MKKTKPTDSLTRTPAGHIPREVAVSVLTTAKKLTSKSRKRFKQSLGKVVGIELAEPKTEQETYTRKLRGWSMAQLGRRVAQNRVRIRVLLGLRNTVTTEKSKQDIERALAVEIYRTDWIRDEIEYRIKPVKPVVKPAPPVTTIEEAKKVLGV